MQHSKKGLEPMVNKRMALVLYLGMNTMMQLCVHMPVLLRFLFVQSNE